MTWSWCSASHCYLTIVTVNSQQPPSSSPTLNTILGHYIQKNCRVFMWQKWHISKQFVEAPYNFTKNWELFSISLHLSIWCGIQEEQLSRVIWQKAASQNCHPSWQRMDSSDLDTHLIHGSLDPRKSVPKTRLRSVQLFLHSSPECPTHTDHVTCNKLRAITLAIGMWWGLKIKPNQSLYT